ncbi:hypothetical protein F4777DRAFT_304982 [Nemania sp. FL0916]|nr:hypothetical protein F4777DRAFT_304982 [Nemania sp. FL0916]
MSSESIEFDPQLADISEGRNVLIPAILFSVLIILTTSLRIISRFWVVKRLSADDLFIVIALGFNLAGNILEVQCVNAGLGRHLQFLSSEERSTVRKLTLFSILNTILALWSVKVSISLFLYSIVGNVNRPARWTICGLITITSLASFAQLVVWILQANPISKAWSPETPGTIASSYNLLVAHIVSQVVGATTDLFYALFPIYYLAPLQMSMKRKVKILSMTGSGLIVFAVSVAHLAFVRDFLNKDYSWALHRVFVFILIERNTAEIIANLPGLYPLFRHVYGISRHALTRYPGSEPNIISSSPVDRTREHAVIKIGYADSLKKKLGEETFDAYGSSARLDGLDAPWDGDDFSPREESPNPSACETSI